jgi:phenylalanyl-tRNA synthetase alpha subunit
MASPLCVGGLLFLGGIYMEEMLREIQGNALREIEAAQASGNLEEIRVRVLGKKGELTALLRGMGKLAPEERPKAGQMVNDAREAIEAALAARMDVLATSEKEARLAREAIDVTLPGPARVAGAINPMYMALEKMIDIFVGMGYEVVEGPEVEYDKYNFELLNLPKNHPSRDMQDTFYDDAQAADPHHLPRQNLPCGRGGRDAFAGVPSDGGSRDRRGDRDERPQGNARRVRARDVPGGDHHAVPSVVFPVHGAVRGGRPHVRQLRRRGMPRVQGNGLA